jgi:hypothetical protein
MSSLVQSSEVQNALAALERAGFSVAVMAPAQPFRMVSVATAAERLAVSQDWVRDNLEEFRGACRLGSVIRIPESDLAAVARRRRIFAGQPVEGRE